jgi:hypothetical protein
METKIGKKLTRIYLCIVVVYLSVYLCMCYMCIYMHMYVCMYV